MTKTPPTPRQQALAARVRCVLEAHGVVHTETVDDALEPVIRFTIATATTASLSVAIIIVDDAFVFEANDATFYRDLAAWPADDEHGWMDDCVRVLQSLLDADLRIRVRRTLLGGATGAVWIPTLGGGAWSGELGACQGRGQEFSFSRWPALNTIQRVIAAWREDGVIPEPAATAGQIAGVERALQAPLPRDMAALYCVANGMPSDVWDRYLLRFWTLDEIVAEAKGNSPSGGYVAFADYSLSAYDLGIRLGPERSGEVAILGESPIVIAESFTRFLQFYLDQPERLRL